MIFIGMPATNPQLPAEPLCLIFGDEDFLVRERASQIFEGWCTSAGGEDHEIVNGTVRNATEALQVLAKLNEAVQTLPFLAEPRWCGCARPTFLAMSEQPQAVR